MKKLMLFLSAIFAAVIALSFSDIRAFAQSLYAADQVAYGDPSGSGSLVTDNGFLRYGPDSGLQLDDITITTAGGDTISTVDNLTIQSTATNGSITINSGLGDSSNNGGDMNVNAGNGTSTSAGGQVTINAGGGGISQGAELYLAPGLNGTPAQTFLYGANGDTGGGELDLIGGGGSNANTNGGGSNNYTGAAGSAQLFGGNADVNGTPGNVVVQGGAIAYSRSSVNAGSVTLAGGITNGTGAGGDIILSIGTGPGAGGAPLGKLKIANATTHTSSPSSGGAGALPSTPAGYVSVYINGVARQIAYY